MREMTHPDGAFYSTQDADSEGEEGKFYVWDEAEIKDLLGDDAQVFMRAYDVSRSGNFEGKNILNRPLDFDVVANEFGMPLDELEVVLERSRAALFDRRDGRIKTGLDDKVITSWNGLMLAAFADAAKILDRADYLEAARRNARFMLSELRTDEGRLRRTWKDGRASLNGYLEDYSYLAEGLLALYEASFEPEWFVAARDLIELMVARFADGDGGFFDTSDDHETLIARPKNVQDNATPSGSAIATGVLLRLASLTGQLEYADIAEQAFPAGRWPYGEAPDGLRSVAQRTGVSLRRASRGCDSRRSRSRRCAGAPGSDIRGFPPEHGGGRGRGERYFFGAVA